MKLCGLGTDLGSRLLYALRGDLDHAAKKATTRPHVQARSSKFCHPTLKYFLYTRHIQRATVVFWGASCAA